MINKLILKNTILLTMANVINKAALFILTIFIARYLREAGFGQYSLVVTITGFFLLLTNYGLGTTAFREISKDVSQAGKYVTNILFIRTCLGVISFLLLVVTIRILSYSPEIALACYVYGITILSTNFIELFTSLFNAYEKMEYAALLMVILNVLTLGFGIAAVRYGLVPLMVSSVFAGIFAVIIGFKLATRMVRLDISCLDKDFIVTLLRESTPIMLIGFLGIIYFRVDIVLLSKLKTSADVGIYNAAYKLMDSFMIVSTAIIGATFPHISRYSKLPAKQYGRIFAKLSYVMFGLGTLISLVTFYYADGIVKLMFGSGYQESVQVLKIVIWTVPFIYINAVLLYTLIGFNQQKRLVPLVFIVTLTNLLLNIIYIPRYGYWGASVVTLGCEIIMFTGYYYLIRKHLSLSLLRNPVTLKPLRMEQ